MKQQVIYRDPEADRKENLKKRILSLPKVTLPFRSKRKVPEEVPGVPKKVMSEVKEEIVKKELQKTLEQEEKLRDLTKTGNQVLFKCVSTFPFDFFPDEITIEPTQVNASIKTFYLTRRLISVPIRNISDISVQTSIFFASITVIDKYFSDNSFTIDYLQKEEAKKFRKIVQGLIIATREDVDVSRIDTDTLKKRAEQLGKMRQLET